jgi:L-iditol 2-dehydrogenase
MRVASYYSNKDLRIENMPLPRIGRQDILMKVMASGICGSDVMEWYRIHKVPLVLGHEVAGVVEKTGRAVERFKVGDRIVATHHVPCNVCEYCGRGHQTVCETLRETHFEPGGFAEYLRLSPIHVRQGVLKLPGHVSFEEATFVEPLGCVVRGQRLAGMSRGRRILVVGSGLSGLLHIKLAAHQGAKSIIATDVDSYRMKKAKAFGATAVLHAGEDIPAEVKRINRGRLADLVILCSPAQAAFRQGLSSLERGGEALIFTAAEKDVSLPLSTNDIFWRSEATIRSSYAASPRDLKEALSLIAKGWVRVDDMITHRLPLEAIQEGFDFVCQPRSSLKVIIRPHHH